MQIVESRVNPSTPSAASTKIGPLRLGDVLVQQKLISAAQLAQTLDLQRTTGKKLGRLLIETGMITEELLASTLARQLKIPFVNLKSYPLRPEVVKLLPETIARRHKGLVINVDEDVHACVIAMSDPLDLFAYDEFSRLTKRSVSIVAVPESQLTSAFDRVYRRTDEISGLAKELEKDIGDAVDFGELSETAGAEGAPVVRLLQSLFEDAIMVGASDIHIEPQETMLHARVRVDGNLQTQTQADKRIAGALAQRLKLMAGLDISEKRLPQDGRFSVRLKDCTIDVRISTLPTIYGESIVMRLLIQESGTRRLNDIGMPKEVLSGFRDVLSKTAGMVLVTGPTGSGKTTTLYAALSEINTPDVKVITVEDPIEYRIPRITQVQVNDKIDLNFAAILRSCLRQDPDILLVGEMRDYETAEVGLRAAITGHLVMSTLHTRDAATAPMRLIDMGVPPFMVANSLQAIVAQRLIRSICPECKEIHEPSPQEKSWLVAMDPEGAISCSRGRGCSSCNGTGYSGRVGVYEMLMMDQELAQVTARADLEGFMKLAKTKMQGKTMSFHAFDLIRRGVTTVSEAMRVGSD